MEKESGKSWIIPVVIIVAIIASGFLFYFYTLKPPTGLANDASGNTSQKPGSIKWYPYEEGLVLVENLNPITHLTKGYERNGVFHGYDRLGKIDIPTKITAKEKSIKKTQNSPCRSQKSQKKGENRKDIKAIRSSSD